MPRSLWLSALLWVSFTSVGWAQVTPYTVVHSSGVFNPLPAGTDHVPVAYGSQPAWDEGSVRIPLPFNFQFFGRNYDEIWAYTNGFLGFEGPPTGQTILGPPFTVPSLGSAVGPYIAPMWGDLDRDRFSPNPATPRIRSAVLGPTGQRQFVIEYTGLVRARSMLSSAAFKVTLQEGTGRIEVQYGPNSGIIDATAAVQGEGGTDGFSLHRSSASCTGTCPCGAGLCSSNGNFPDGLVVTLTLPLSAELVGGVTGPPGAAPGDSFPAEIIARNAGLLASSAFDFEVYLSPSNTSLASATRLGNYRATSGLNPLSSDVRNETLTVPTAVGLGTFFLSMSVDTGGEVTEAIETNNVFFGEVFRTGAELQGRSIQLPSVSGPGESIAVVLTIDNQGAPVSDAFDVRFYLSQDAQLDAGDFDLGAQSFTLANGFSFSDTISLSLPTNIPLSPPSYRLLARIDDGLAIPELNESNNLLISATTIRLEGPDVTVGSIASSPIMVRNRAYPIEVVVENTGGGQAEDFYVCVLLRSNGSFDLLTDQRLAEAGPLSLRPGQSTLLRLEPLIPITASATDTFLAAAVDCRGGVSESNESNNILPRETQVEVRNVAPDFAIEAVSAAAEAPILEDFPVVVQVANLGTTSGRPTIGFYISSDEVFDESDENLTTEDGPELAPFEVDSASFTLNFPERLAGQATTLLAVADPSNLLLEAREDDNSAFAAITVMSPVLRVSTEPPASSVIGRAYEWVFTAVGPGAERVWTLTWDSGTAPAGLSFDPSTASISGTPEASAEGFHPFTVEVSSDGERATSAGRLAVLPLAPPLRIVTLQLPAARAAEPYDSTLAGSGGFPPYVWSLEPATALPIGLAFENGRFSGEPALPSSEIFQVRLQDRFEQTVVGPVALEIVDPRALLQVTTAAVPSSIRGQAYQTAFSAAPDSPTLAWRLDGPGVPGLALSPNGRLEGTATESGVFPLRVRVEDTASGLTDSAAFVMEVLEQGDLRILGEAELPLAIAGQAYGPVGLEAEPASASMTWSLVQGELPPGLQLEGPAISGTPTELGNFPFVVEVRNAAQETRRAARIILVRTTDEPALPPADSGCRAVSNPSLGGAWPVLVVLLSLVRRRRTRSRSPKSRSTLS